LAVPCPEAEAFLRGRRDAAPPLAHVSAARLVQAQAAPDALVPGAPEISLAGQRALHWPLAWALPADSLAHREATDSNLVWAPQEQVYRRQAASRLQQASLRQAQEKLRGARPRARLRVA
jgi:hypothetical protein